MSEPGKADRPGCRRLLLKWTKEVTVTYECEAAVECHPDDDHTDAINELEVAGLLEWKEKPSLSDEFPDYGRAELVRDEGPVESERG